MTKKIKDYHTEYIWNVYKSTKQEIKNRMRDTQRQFIDGKSQMVNKYQDRQIASLAMRDFF